MIELERWLARQAAREGHIVVLEEGLLGGRLWRYSFYRLRYFFLRYVVESVTHAVTVVFLFRGAAWFRPETTGKSSYMRRRQA